MTVMEFKRDSAIALYLAGNSQVAIVRALQHLNVNKSFVSRTIVRYKDPDNIAKRYGGGRKKSATSSEIVRKVKKKKNSRRSGSKMAAELNISVRNVQRIVQNEFKLKPLKLQKAHDLIPQQKKSKSGTSQEIVSLL
ncbi:unnamed protein product [Hermetia illucens]|uniref:Uncharacterized protein n=1 Tax=Hermetia illucens TaxID=343691 RepID=A0A7R8YLJ7_HERIL|nr:unnamed protein product [Hermetia illucens]